MRKWDELPDSLRLPEVREYYDYLAGRRAGLLLKRVFDLCAASLMMIILSPLFVILAAVILLDSRGGVFFRQERVTQYGEIFRIHKFRTMISDADKRGFSLTTKHDSRITRAGKYIRRWHLDEIPQLIDILQGNMSFVGTRPEVPEYVRHYTPEMMATLLLPAGITSKASIIWQKKEAELLGTVKPQDTEKFYIEHILPEKMKYNLESIKNFTFWGDISLMLKTTLSLF